MHVKTKKMAIAGLLVAFATVLVVLSSVIETSSLFFIGAASFTVGIAIREWGVQFGAGFLAASILVNIFVAPNKFYSITFAMMGLYLLLSELLWEKIAVKGYMRNRTLIFWIGKYVIFNCIYIPAILFFQELIFVREITGILLLGAFFAGQAALFIYDKAYLYFQGTIWGNLRVKLMK